jgi:hypothetical protein
LLYNVKSIYARNPLFNETRILIPLKIKKKKKPELLAWASLGHKHVAVEFQE